MDNDASLAFSMYLRSGTMLQGGKYKIIRFISNGGFGCTYEALHVMLNKRVAIKEFFVKDFCNRDDNTSCVSIGTTSKTDLVEKLRKKFIDEARAISSLSHPGIVQVSDVFSENGTAYYVMGYIEGKSLRQLIKENGPLDETRALKYISQVCEALRYVHGKNRLHLDIKPGNIMLDGKDNAILIDFGVSKQYDEAGGENTSTLLGKTQGFAPLEQLGGNVKKFMPATDIYAVGATLYMLLSGKKPISANDLAQGDELPPLPPYVSDNTRKAVNRAMKVKIPERPQDIDEFLAILFDSDSGLRGNHNGDDDTIVSGNDVRFVPPLPPAPPVVQITERQTEKTQPQTPAQSQPHRSLIKSTPVDKQHIKANDTGDAGVATSIKTIPNLPKKPPVVIKTPVPETRPVKTSGGSKKTIWILAFIAFIAALCIYVTAMYASRSNGSYYDTGYVEDEAYDAVPVEEYADVAADSVAAIDDSYDYNYAK